jgi:hypothetical protein
MAIIASEPPSSTRRSERRLARSGPASLSRPPVPRAAASEMRIESVHTDNLRAVTGVLESVGTMSGAGSLDGSVIENEFPLSGCRLKVMDLPDGSRIGQLYGPSGQWLDEAKCELTSQVSGWFGRTESGATWALAFGAGGAQESLEVRFASLRARRVVPVVSDHYGLWVAEVVGNFRAATILASTRVTTFRLHYVA